MKNQKGFTLMELIIVMVIIVLLSSILMISGGQQREKLALNRSARQLAQDLREVEEMAMAAKMWDCPGEDPSNIFGIYIKKKENQYTLFVDCGPRDLGFSVAQDVVIRTVFLDQGVGINDFLDFPPPPPQVNIVFEPSDPKVYLNGSDAPGLEVGIELCLVSACTLPDIVSKIVQINTVGMIEIE